jgi:hypothetical protein
MFGRQCAARYHPVTICATGQIPNSVPKFHQPMIVDGVGKSTRASFVILNEGCLFRVGLFIILCVVVVPWMFTTTIRISNIHSTSNVIVIIWLSVTAVWL